MKLEEIEKIIKAEVEGSDGSYPKNVIPATKEIYKLHLEDKKELLTTLIQMKNSSYEEWFKNNMLEELQQELKTLEE